MATDRSAIDVNGGGECRSFNNLMIDCVQMYRQGTRPKDEIWLERWNPVLKAYGDGKIENTPHSKYRDFKAWLSKKEKDDFFRPVSYVYNNVLFHPNDDILMERNVDINTSIKDNSKVLIAKYNWATKEDPGFSDYQNGDYSLDPDALVYKKIRGFKPILFEQMGRRN